MLNGGILLTAVYEENFKLTAVYEQHETCVEWWHITYVESIHGCVDYKRMYGGS
jgi:hypothetical protein